MNMARQGRAEKVFFASSSEVYGNSLKLPFKEKIGGQAWSPYTAVKMFGEQTMRALWQQYKIPTLSFRFFNVYGPRQRGRDYGFVVSQFLIQAMAGQKLTVHGDGRPTRDFVYIRDNISLTIAAME